MKKIIHRAHDRGIQDHGWLKAAHSFSFASFYDPSKMHFGLLRVLNDDIISAGRGFGMHRHDNMEIVTIPLHGSISHKDSLGSAGEISAGEVQIMSAGSGIQHSEFNSSPTDETNLLQIWVFPKVSNNEPRYDQKKFDPVHNAFTILVSPDENDGGMWINQDAVFSMGTFDQGETAHYRFKFKKNGVYVFVIEGQIELDGEILNKRDAAGVYGTSEMQLVVSKSAKILMIEVPLE